MIASTNVIGHGGDSTSNNGKLFDKLIWGIDDVCAFTAYAKGTIYNLVSKGEIPFRKRSKKGRLVFVPSEVIAWFKGERT